MCLFCNEIPTITPEDATQTLKILEFKTIFKNELTEKDKQINNITNECKFMIGNDDVKKIWIKKEEYQNALIHIIIKNYSNEIIKNNKNNDDYLNTNGKLETINELYEFTPERENKILRSEVYKNIISSTSLSKSRIKLFLQKEGVTEGAIQGNVYLKGIKQK